MGSTRNRVRRAIIAVASGILLAVGVAPAAAAPVHGCSDGYWCGFKNTEYGGDQCSWYYSAATYAAWCDNVMSSYVNNGDGVVSRVQWFEHQHYSGWRGTVPSIKEFPNGKNPWVGINNNDKMSSHTWCTC